MLHNVLYHLHVVQHCHNLPIQNSQDHFQGEKRKINLSVVLALKDLLMLTDKDQSNLLFFDEVAENLDDQGVHGLYQLLQEIKKDKNIFVITHNKYLKTLLDSSKRLSIIKENGVSTIRKK